MALKLKPLLLPELVEQRRKHETLVQQGAADADQTFIYYTHHSSSSSSDIGSRSPLTPTFSRSQSRYSGSTSSLEQLSSSYSESPASPAQASSSIKGGKSLLPDVQEDPLREDEHIASVADEHRGLYDCLCDEPCMHHDTEPTLGNNFTYLGTDMDYYDLGFMSDSDFSIDERAKKQRSGDESPFAGLSRRVSSKISGHVSRWRSSSKRNNFTFSPASDPSLDQGTTLSRAASRAASSRSSSISAPARYIPDRLNEPPLPPTPALSMYGSSDSVAPAEVLDIEQTDVRKSLERERALAATPLLPPLLIERPAFSAPPSLHPSPLQSPTVAAMASMTIQEAASTAHATPPPLSSKPSVSSFRPMVSPASPIGELPSPIPNMIEHDEWSDLLGHANFTIVPRPYHPTTTDMEALTCLRANWDLAKVNYTKHLCRTGEHYGLTSNTYTLTQAKWAEIEREWRTIENKLVDHIIKHRGEEVDPAELIRRGRQEDVFPAIIPSMIEGKFPERGDVDIVGPMQRDAVMIRDVSRDVSPIDDRKHVSAWLKSLAGKVGLRK